MVPWVFVMVIGRKRFGEDFVVERKGLLSYMTGFHLFYSVEEGFAGFDVNFTGSRFISKILELEFKTSEILGGEINPIHLNCAPKKHCFKINTAFEKSQLIFYWKLGGRVAAAL